ncbi:MAG: hypothetical protein COB36_12380 [Alphaproteobacteria bacterium]|nr:MAG: hypothetical protein COB36_12380 [Alphaproteobacteria bacterium]
MFKKLFFGTVLLALGAQDSFAQEQDLQLSVSFPVRTVVKVQAGDFHFIPGQRAPIHTHDAPALGYVSKGTILYKVEGRAPVLLKEGDVFYEPVGPRIMMFDNASTIGEAIFIDINLQQEGEPFIVFEKPPTEAIDRRTLPEKNYDGIRIDGAKIYIHTLQPDAKQYIDISNPVSGYIAQGNVEIRIDGKRVNA